MIRVINFQAVASFFLFFSELDKVREGVRRAMRGSEKDGGKVLLQVIAIKSLDTINLRFATARRRTVLIEIMEIHINKANDKNR